MVPLGCLLMFMDPIPNRVERHFGKPLLIKEKKIVDENWIIMGDFNTHIKENEKMGGS